MDRRVKTTPSCEDRVMSCREALRDSKSKSPGAAWVRPRHFDRPSRETAALLPTDLLLEQYL